MREFVGLRPKCYAFLCTGKVDNTLDTRHEEKKISSTNHTVRTVHTRKVGLTAFDTKRWLCEDTVHTHSHGHKDTESDPSDLFSNSYIVNCFTNVGIFTHKDLP